MGYTISNNLPLYQSISLADSNELEAAGSYIDITSGKSGYCELIIGNSIAFAKFIFDTSGVVTLIEYSGNVFNALQTGTNHVIIKDNGSNVRIVNELGSTLIFTLTINYTN